MRREKGSIEIVEHEKGQFMWYCSCGAGAMQFSRTSGAAKAKGNWHLQAVHGLLWKSSRLRNVPCPDCLKVTMPLRWARAQSFGRFCEHCQKIWRPDGQVMVVKE